MKLGDFLRDMHGVMQARDSVGLVPPAVVAVVLVEPVQEDVEHGDLLEGVGGGAGCSAGESGGGSPAAAPPVLPGRRQQRRGRLLFLVLDVRGLGLGLALQNGT